MISVASEYHTRDTVKIARRPARSAMKPKKMVPTNIPAKVQKTKKPTPLRPKKCSELRGEQPALDQPGRDIGRS